MGLQSPMESRKSENARLQPAPEDGNATNLGREIYDRHLSMSSVAGQRSAAWQALQLEAFGANRLPMLARLSQRWAKVSILPAARTSAYEWYAARSASPRLRPNPVSLPGQSTFPLTSPVALIPASEASTVSAPVAAESGEPVHTPGVVTENPDKKVEWGPPIFQAGNSLRMNGARISRNRANGNESGHVIPPSAATQENKPSTIRDEKPILRQEAEQLEPLHQAETPSDTNTSGRLPLVRAVESVESVASSIVLTEAERNIASTRQGSTAFNSAAAQLAVTPVRGQTSGTSDSGSPTSADPILVDARDERRIPGVSFTQSPMAAVALKHVNRIARKAVLLKGNTNNTNNKEAGETHRDPILPVRRAEKQSQTRISTEDVVSREAPGASRNIAGDDIGQSSAQIELVPAGLKSEMTRDTPTVVTSEVSSLPLVTSHSPAIRTPERSHLQRSLKDSPVESAEEPAERSKAPAGALPVVAAEAISSRTAGTIMTPSTLSDSPKSLIAPSVGAPPETGIVLPIESPSQTEFPARLLAGKSQIFRSADRHDAGETRVVAQSQTIDIPNSEAPMDSRTSVAGTIEEVTMLKQGARDAELTYQDQVATDSARSVVDHNLGPAGDSSNSIVFDTSASQPDKGVLALSHSGAVASHRRAQEPQASKTRVASLAPFVQRTPAQEVHRSAGSNAASSISVQRAVTSGSSVQARSASNSSSVIRTHQISAFPVGAERTHMQRATAAATPPDAIEGSVPLPFASASAGQNAESAPAIDVGQIADRVYHMLVDRLASERSRRGM